MSQFTDTSLAKLIRLLLIAVIVLTPLLRTPAVVTAQTTSLISVSVEGPRNGETGTKYQYSAEIYPKSASGPIEYLWYPEPNEGQGTSGASYTWDSAGKQTVKVTVTGADDKEYSDDIFVGISERNATAVTAASITAEAGSSIAINQMMTATLTLAPAAANDYTVVWTPYPEDGQGKPQATFRWATPGIKRIEAQIINGDNSTVTTTKSVQVGAAYDHQVFLPFAVTSTAVQAAGIEETTIIGGREADPGDWPWMVALMTDPTAGVSGHYCGGALIAPEWVLTAAHCVESWGTATLYVAIGRHRLSDTDGEVRTVAEIIMHPDYNADTIDYDIALLQLASPATIAPVSLDAPAFAPGESATVIGWGLTIEGVPGSAPDALMQVDVPIVSDAVCNDNYLGGITDRMFCAGAAGTDACQGDSGGPIVFPTSGESTAQIGIVSWGEGCARAGFPGVYSDLRELRSWIDDHLGTAETPDAYEPDNSIASASPISSGAMQSHNFHVPGDEDWLRFDAVSGSRYVVETLNLGAQSDTVLSLHEANGDQILSNDDQSGLASRIEWVSTTDGPLFVRVRHYSSTRSGAATSYDIRLSSSVDTATGDAYEPDNVMAQASTIGVDDAAQYHTFHLPGDEDWLRFSAQGGQEYRIETADLEANSDTYLYLYDADGNQLTRNDDSDGGLASRIDWIASADETFYVRVRHYASLTGGDETGYNISVTQSTQNRPGDAYEEDNRIDQSTAIAVDGDAQTHDFHAPGDGDWIYFDSTTNGRHIIETLNLASASDTYISLHDADGRWLASDDDGGSDYASRLEWPTSPGERYYVRISHYAGNAFGDDTAYDIQVTSESSEIDDPWEPNDAVPDATPIGVDGVSQTHAFYVSGDVDYLGFDAVAGDRYLAATFNLGARADTVLTLINAAGESLAHDDDDGDGYASLIEWTAPASGRYYLVIRHYASSVGGVDTNYDVSVTRFPASAGDAYEPDNVTADASDIEVGGSAQAHTFHVADDIDLIRFTGNAGTIYVIETFNLGSNSDTYLRLFAPDGELLQSDDDGGGGLSSRIRSVVDQNGIHYIAVNNIRPDAGGSDTDYSISIYAEEGGGGDAYEVDDSMVQASAITVNGPFQEHDFHVPGDLDWVGFTAEAGGQYTIETFDLGAGSDTVLFLVDSAGSILATNDDYNGGLASWIDWQAQYSGSHYAVVAHYDGEAYGEDTNYRLQITVDAVRDGGFELDEGVWTEYSLQGADLITDSPPKTAHGGSAVVWLGGLDEEVSFVNQRVIVPESAPYLNHWLWIESNDVCGYDVGAVMVNGEVEYWYDLCSETATGGWIEHAFDLSAFAGQTIELALVAETDVSEVSNLFIDDVSFVATLSAATLPLGEPTGETQAPKPSQAEDTTITKR